MYGDGVSVWQDAQSKKWVGQVRIAVPGQKPFTRQKRTNSRTEARQWAQEIRRNAKTAARPQNNSTFEVVLGKYFEQMQSEMNEGTLSQYMHLLKLYAVPAFGDQVMEDIHPQAIRDFLNDLRKRGLAPSTINTVRSRLLSVFAFAKIHAFVSHDPSREVKRHRAASFKETKVQSPWSPDEARQALAAFEGTILEVFVTIALVTGMRKGEILALKWEDLDNRGVLRVTKSRSEKRYYNSDGTFSSHVSEGDTKTAASLRSLQLDPMVLAAVERQRQRVIDAGHEIRDTDYIVTSESFAPISLSTLHRTYRRICETSNLRRIRIHDMRHTAAVLALTFGAALVEVSQGLGHSGVEITKRTYAPVVPGLTGRFTAKVCEALAEPKGTPQG